MENNPRRGPSSPVYTLYTVPRSCATCGEDLKHKRPQSDFCSDHCRYQFHNRRRANKSPPPAVTGAGADITTVSRLATHLTRHTKLFNVLAALASGKSFNRFQAEQEFHDHVLPSTIQGIEKFGIVVLHKPEIVPGFQGSRIRTVRYSLSAEEQEKAAVLLGWRTCRDPS